MNWMQSVSKSLPLIMGNPVEPEPEPIPIDCGEICVDISTRLEGELILNNIMPEKCIYGIDVDVTTKYILKEVNKIWELQDDRGVVLASSATLLGVYDLLDPDLINFKVSTCRGGGEEGGSSEGGVTLR